MKQKTVNLQLLKKITAIIFVFCLAVFLFVPNTSVHAQELTTGLTAVGENAGMPTASLTDIIGNIIKIILGILGILLIGIIIYAGFLYMTSGGNPDQAKKAIVWIKNAVIGLTIIIFSYAITTFIINMLTGDDGGGDGNINIAGNIPGGSLSGGAFGTVIQSHYPAPEQTNVVRNSMIMVTFRQPVGAASVITPKEDGAEYPCPAGFGEGKVCGNLTASFNVYRCAEATLAECNDLPADKTLLVPGYAIMTEDKRTVMFNPYGDSNELAKQLGSETENVPYIVKLTSGITVDGKPGVSIFRATSPQYFWRFETGTEMDLIPPQVRMNSLMPPKLDAYPKVPNEPKDKRLDDGGFVYLNQIIIANFNEPVMALTSQTQDCSLGDSKLEAQVINFQKVAPACALNTINGDWRIGINNFRTIQFLSNLPCKNATTNSCGEKVYCLPQDATINVALKSAAPLGESGCPGLVGTGIMDMAGNALDGNANGTCDGVVADIFQYEFKTKDSIDVTAPQIVRLDPANAAANIAVDLSLGAEFSEALDPESVDQQVTILGETFDGYVDPNMATLPDGDTNLEKIMIRHASFAPAQAGAVIKYTPIVRSLVKDSRQNCFTPSRDGTSACKDADKGVSCCPNLGAIPFQQQKVNAASCGLPSAEVVD